MATMRGHLVLACNPDSAVVRPGKLKLFMVGEEKPRWTIPAHGYGANGPGWGWTGGDTPPGRYRLGVVYTISFEEQPIFGDYCIDLIDLENQETGIGRGGISIHAGRTLYTPTFGCVRVAEDGLARLVQSLRWVRKSTPNRPVRPLDGYYPDDDYLDFTMIWMKGI